MQRLLKGLSAICCASMSLIGFQLSEILLVTLFYFVHGSWVIVDHLGQKRSRLCCCNIQRSGVELALYLIKQTCSTRGLSLNLRQMLLKGCHQIGRQCTPLERQRHKSCISELILWRLGPCKGSQLPCHLCTSLDCFQLVANFRQFCCIIFCTGIGGCVVKKAKKLDSGLSLLKESL